MYYYSEDKHCMASHFICDITIMATSMRFLIHILKLHSIPKLSIFLNISLPSQLLRDFMTNKLLGIP